MKDEKEIEETRTHIYTMRDITDNNNFQLYIAGIVDAINYILEA